MVMHNLYSTGAFGKVLKGEYRTKDGVQEVAVKTLKSEL